ncbi:MAG: hypothetical protein ACT4QG_13490 [Sporichthyaceae bacterium]
MKREENPLPWQVQHEIAQAESLQAHTPWDRAVLAAGHLFLRR